MDQQAPSPAVGTNSAVRQAKRNVTQISRDLEADLDAFLGSYPGNDRLAAEQLLNYLCFFLTKNQAHILIDGLLARYGAKK